MIRSSGFKNFKVSGYASGLSGDLGYGGATHYGSGYGGFDGRWISHSVHGSTISFKRSLNRAFRDSQRSFRDRY